MIIYKITNIINNKVYIGLTTQSIEDRWKEHLRGRFQKNISNRPLYRALNKYGMNNFKIEEIDHANNLNELQKLEIYYIKKFKAQNSKFGYNIHAGGVVNSNEHNPRTKLTIDDIKYIRTLYNECNLSCREVLILYKDKISYDAFQKIWAGHTWKNIMSEVYTVKNKLFHKNQKGNCGEKNSNSKYLDKEVLKMRKFYITHTLEETFKVYGYKANSISSFRSSLNKSYTHIPIYKKHSKVWLLKNNIININDYNLNA